MTEEISTNHPPLSEQNSNEIVANPAFITWHYPPYCELCNVYFSGESCSKIHFDGRNHKNRLHTWKKYQNNLETLSNNSKQFLCEICWKEMNTQLILDNHCKSPAHLKEVKGRSITQKLKDEYRQLKETNSIK
ncbi:unnamed protein product [Rotaria sp. Silwood1]|nr:unnamed protein product [Rotaria sp. Silwood1]CAF3484234.1 unnamed protein product [Rotaria sp. Silwood1]CAF4802486.1 unnamed protein product [Rotaria sp. Silwood1]